MEGGIHHRAGASLGSTLHAHHLEIRLKNKAEQYALTYRVVLDLARALHARAKIQQRS